MLRSFRSDYHSWKSDAADRNDKVPGQNTVLGTGHRSVGDHCRAVLFSSSVLFTTQTRRPTHPGASPPAQSDGWPRKRLTMTLARMVHRNGVPPIVLCSGTGWACASCTRVRNLNDNIVSCPFSPTPFRSCGELNLFPPFRWTKPGTVNATSTGWLSIESLDKFSIWIRHNHCF